MNKSSTSVNSSAADAPVDDPGCENPYAPPVAYVESKRHKVRKYGHIARLLLSAMFFDPAVTFCGASAREAGVGGEIATLDAMLPGIPFVVISFVLVFPLLWKSQSLIIFFISFMLTLGNLVLLLRILHLVVLVWLL